MPPQRVQQRWPVSSRAAGRRSACRHRRRCDAVGGVHRLLQRLAHRAQRQPQRRQQQRQRQHRQPQPQVRRQCRRRRQLVADPGTARVHRPEHRVGALAERDDVLLAALGVGQRAGAVQRRRFQLRQHRTDDADVGGELRLLLPDQRRERRVRRVDGRQLAAQRLRPRRLLLPEPDDALDLDRVAARGDRVGLQPAQRAERLAQPRDRVGAALRLADQVLAALRDDPVLDDAPDAQAEQRGRQQRHRGQQAGLQREPAEVSKHGDCGSPVWVMRRRTRRG
ncbi:MAG: hypothetical protein MZW92_29975 [Comamonadaceae bacterium]|nr:hypothetical protein [Comamonadaceae bacterium]